MSIELTEQEVEAILNYLAQAPYAQVAGLIGKIQAQAQEQITTKKLKGDNNE